MPFAARTTVSSPSLPTALVLAALAGGCSGDHSLGSGLPVTDAASSFDGDAGNVCKPATDAGGGLSQGLLAWYRGEPPASASSTVLVDSSTHGNDGTLVSGVGGNSGWSYGAGKVNQAVRFSAANQGYATLPSSLLAGACEATVAAWVYTNNAGDWQRVFDFGLPESDGTSKIYMYLTVQDQNNKYLHFAISTAGPFSGEQTIDGPVLVTKTWNHVAVVLGSSGGSLYLNGVQVGVNTGLTLRPVDLPHPLDYFVGRSQWRIYDYFLDGNIDELRVYDRALTPDEIAALASGS
jgi:hypothetical protein